MLPSPSTFLGTEVFIRIFAPVLCQVNADDHKEIGEKFGVRGFPTIKFFQRGKPTTSPEE